MFLSPLHGLLSAAVAMTNPAAEAYPAAYFAPYAPQTALDMVERLPGFRLDLGNEGVRGFSEAGGNVLVDGARPAGKSGGLAAALSAIPAGQVARIEIVRSGAAASEASGQAVVANIVRLRRRGGVSASGGLSLTDGHLLGDGSVTATLGLGAFDLTLRTALAAPGERSHGTRVQFDLDGRATGRQTLAYGADFPELSQRLSLAGPFAGGQLKTAAMLSRAWLAEGFSFADEDQVQGFPKRTDRRRGEVSAEWSRAAPAGYAAKLLGLASFTNLDARSWSHAGPTGGDPVVTDRFESRSASREAIVRAVLAGDGERVVRPEFGAEIAWNSLDSRTASIVYGAAPSRSTSATEVSEVRAQGFATVTWRPAIRWTVTAGAAYEASRIRADGGAGRRFGFFKPSLTLAYRPDDRSDLRLSARRSVGQLSFADFAASANLAEGKTYGGNTDLAPDHRTSVALDYDRRFGRRGAVNLGLFHDWRGDVLEAAVLASGAFGAANVAHARVWGLSASLELPTDPVVAGGILKLSYSRQGSRLTDPITGRRRGVTALKPTTLSAGFRQDLAAFSWGVDYARGHRTWFWYADEARSLDHGQDLGVFVETRRLGEAKVQLRVDGLAGTRNTYARLQYAPSRAGAPYQREVWDIRTSPVVWISVSRAF